MTKLPTYFFVVTGVGGTLVVSCLVANIYCIATGWNNSMNRGWILWGPLVGMIVMGFVFSLLILGIRGCFKMSTKYVLGAWTVSISLVVLELVYILIFWFPEVRSSSPTTVQEYLILTSTPCYLGIKLLLAIFSWVSMNELSNLSWMKKYGGFRGVCCVCSSRRRLLTVCFNQNQPHYVCRGCKKKRKREARTKTLRLVCSVCGCGYLPRRRK